MLYNKSRNIGVTPLTHPSLLLSRANNMTAVAAAQSFWTNIFQRDPQVVTHFMILRGSHHLKQDCNSEEKRKRWMGHKRFGDKSRTGVHYRSSSCTDDAGDDGDLVFSTLTFFFVSFGHSVIHFDDFISLSSPIPNRCISYLLKYLYTFFT